MLQEKQAAFELVEEGERSILHNRSRNVPQLRIGTSTTLCRYVLLPRLKPYIFSHPQVHISIACQSTYQTLELLDEENISRQTINARMKEHHMEPAHILEVSTMDLLIRFAETGLGIAGVVRQFVEPELKNGTLCEIPLGFDFPDREIGFVCRKKDRGLPLLQYLFPDI